MTCEKSSYTLILASKFELEIDIPGILVSFEIVLVNKLLSFVKLAWIKIKEINIENKIEIAKIKFLLKVVIYKLLLLIMYFIFIKLIKC